MGILRESAIILEMKICRFIWISVSIGFFLFFSGCDRVYRKKDIDREIHIRKNYRIEYYLNREASLQTEKAVNTAFLLWEDSSDFRFIYSGSGKAGLKRDGRNTISFMLTWPDEAPAGKAAWCLNYYDRNGNIVESDIIFNMALARFTTLETKTPDSYYIEGLLAHEIGHMLGLEHIDSADSLMKPMLSQSESYFMGRIDDETIRQYKKLYPE